MFNLSSSTSRGPSGARGFRAYVIGDVHGRLDLLELLIGRIEDELVQRPARKVLLVFVGDLIDRGPASAQVIEKLRTYAHPHVKTVFVMGNHEEVLLRVLRGDPSYIASWMKFGGAECLQSYGVNPRELRGKSEADALALIQNAIPAAHFEFLESFIDTCRFGDYLFVHAGIRPGVELDQQRQTDLRWIREPFLLSDTDHGYVVVHGHTISPKVEELPNRIGLDTGAYRTGNLTALAIEGSRRWYLSTADLNSGADESVRIDSKQLTN
jgi:serine/threonine protein phosphatase 1